MSAEKKTTRKKTTQKSGARAKPVGGRPPVYDWSALRRAYIRGDNSVTLESLSHKTGAPALGTLKNRAAEEDWSNLRALFREQTVTRLQEVDLEALTEVRARQAKIGKSLQVAAVRALAHLRPEEVTPTELVRLAQVGAELERRARGMEEYTVNLAGLNSPADLQRLTPEELMELLQLTRKRDGPHSA